MKLNYSNIDFSVESIKGISNPVILVGSKKKCFDYHSSEYEDLFIPGDMSLQNNGYYDVRIGNQYQKNAEYKTYTDID